MTTRQKSATISATEFKARCLELMDLVRDSGTSITITKRGIPVARLTSMKARQRIDKEAEAAAIVLSAMSAWESVCLSSKVVC